jgi:hypothetical protein
MFAGMPEPLENKLTIMVSNSDLEKLRSMADADGISVSDLTRKMGRQEFDRRLGEAGERTKKMLRVFHTFRDAHIHWVERFDDVVADRPPNMEREAPKSTFLREALDDVLHFEPSTQLLKPVVDPYKSALDGLTRSDQDNLGQARATLEGAFKALVRSAEDHLDEFRARDLRARRR